MAKDPAFLFYPGDWVTGTMGMTFEEKGAYIELLMMQFSRGHMTSRMAGQVVGQLWDTLKDKFSKDEDGLWYNKRLDEEKILRKKFTESRVNNIKGKNQHTKNKGHMRGHTTSRMEDEDINEDKSISKDSFGKPENLLSDHDIEKTIQFCAIVMKKNFTPDSLREMWKAFIIQTEGEFYKNMADKVRHFQNWLKTKTDGQQSKPGTSAARIRAAKEF